MDPDAWVVNEGNTTRRVTDAGLQEELCILRCSSSDCHEEMEALGIYSAVVVQPEQTGYPRVVPTAIASTTQFMVEVVATSMTGTSAVSGASAQGVLIQPRVTGINAPTDGV